MADPITPEEQEKHLELLSRSVISQEQGIIDWKAAQDGSGNPVYVPENKTFVDKDAAQAKADELNAAYGINKEPFTTGVVDGKNTIVISPHRMRVNAEVIAKKDKDAANLPGDLLGIVQKKLGTELKQRDGVTELKHDFFDPQEANVVAWAIARNATLIKKWSGNAATAEDGIVTLNYFNGSNGYGSLPPEFYTTPLPEVKDRPDVSNKTIVTITAERIEADDEKHKLSKKESAALKKALEQALKGIQGITITQQSKNQHADNILIAFDNTKDAEEFREIVGERFIPSRTYASWADSPLAQVQADGKTVAIDTQHLFLSKIHLKEPHKADPNWLVGAVMEQKSVIDGRLREKKELQDRANSAAENMRPEVEKFAEKFDVKVERKEDEWVVVGLSEQMKTLLHNNLNKMMEGKYVSDEEENVVRDRFATMKNGELVLDERFLKGFKYTTAHEADFNIFKSANGSTVLGTAKTEIAELAAQAKGYADAARAAATETKKLQEQAAAALVESNEELKTRRDALTAATQKEVAAKTALEKLQEEKKAAENPAADASPITALAPENTLPITALEPDKLVAAQKQEALEKAQAALNEATKEKEAAAKGVEQNKSTDPKELAGVAAITSLISKNPANDAEVQAKIAETAAEEAAKINKNADNLQVPAAAKAQREAALKAMQAAKAAAEEAQKILTKAQQIIDAPPLIMTSAPTPTTLEPAAPQAIPADPFAVPTTAAPAAPASAAPPAPSTTPAAPAPSATPAAPAAPAAPTGAAPAAPTPGAEPTDTNKKDEPPAPAGNPITQNMFTMLLTGAPLLMMLSGGVGPLLGGILLLAGLLLGGFADGKDSMIGGFLGNMFGGAQTGADTPVADLAKVKTLSELDTNKDRVLSKEALAQLDTNKDGKLSSNDQIPEALKAEFAAMLKKGTNGEIDLNALLPQKVGTGENKKEVPGVML
ncbi:MAG: hypothetical protein SFX19_09205 [Alphaproteobacteria bacterium]|nr:hypothetical protein [Alphaproteobacteria bacterium]